MNNDDPFFSTGGDRTVIRPVPGGRVEDIQRQTQATFSENKGVQVPLSRLSKLNPLDNAASSILALIANLYNSPSHSAPDQLKAQVIQEIKSFELSANKADIDQDTIQKARYALCTTIDEAVFNTPWGRQSGWAENSLLSIFHNEVSGGKRFFQMLQELGKNPSQNLHLLELMYVCLALGFQGRYRLDNDGNNKLAQIRSWLASLIHQTKGSAESDLSPHWKGVEIKNSGLMRLVPIWVFFVVSASLVLLLYLGLLFSLGAKANPVYGNVQSLDMDINTVTLPKAVPVVSETAPPFDRIAFLKKWLAPEIRQDLVKIHDPEGKIEIRGEKGLFASGSGELLSQRVGLVEKVADALASPEFDHSNYLVIGHTDNVPLRTSVRFSNNWELSKARAETVKNLLKRKQSTLMLRTDGKADSDPLNDNKTKTSRARNRRVDIVLD